MSRSVYRSVYPPAEREALVNRATALRVQGYGWMTIGRELGVPSTTIKRWLDPSFNARQFAAARAAKQRRTGRCRGCGHTTRYNGQKGLAVSEWCHGCRSRQATKWTREAILNAIRTWAAEHGGQPPSAIDWNPALAAARGNYGQARRFELDSRWPWTNSVVSRFGTWNEAVRQAGFEPRRSGSHGPVRIGA